MSAPRPAACAPPRGRVLCFAPHPDDELLGAGGTLCLHAAAGDSVTVVVAFDGRLGLAPGADPAVRRREALAGGAHLGLRDYEFLDYPEGHEPTAAELEQAVVRLARVLRERAPEVVYAPWPGEEHRDHRVVARTAAAALARVGFSGTALSYEVWTPLAAERVVDVTQVFEKKLAALREHTSQLAHTDLVRIACERAAERSALLPRGARHGEAFAPLVLSGTGAPL